MYHLFINKYLFICKSVLLEKNPSIIKFISLSFKYLLFPIIFWYSNKCARDDGNAKLCSSINLIKVFEYLEEKINSRLDTFLPLSQKSLTFLQKKLNFVLQILNSERGFKKKISKRVLIIKSYLLSIIFIEFNIESVIFWSVNLLNLNLINSLFFKQI